ncbi:MAG: hypothetical protein GQ559_08830, partial [Desulfobulbaceae bacterium]|nr:hypothetical protein [Desulfobulbaceae bacterium]
MNDKAELPAKKTPARRRKKLWEVYTGHQCSILGICLRQSDLRRLARKKIFKVEPGSSVYQIHSALVHQATTRNSQARALHNLLDTKYRAAVNRYAKVTDDEAIKKLWEQDLKCGGVAGAYWAIMTHPAVTKEVTAYIYGQSHMMAHDCFSEYQRDRRQIEELRNKAAILEEVLGSERQHYLQGEKELKNEITALRKVQQESIAIAGENEELRKKNGHLKSEFAESSLSRKQVEMKLQLADIRQHNVGLCGRIDELTSELDDSRDLFRLADRTIAELEEENAALKAVKDEQAREIVSMETALLVKMAASCGCAVCEDQHTNRCPGPDLCGKIVLYVGGRYNMVPRYRQLV